MLQRLTLKVDQSIGAGQGLQERLKKILMFKDSSYVNNFIDRNETSVIATLRLFKKDQRDALVKVNRKVVEQEYSQENIGEQLYNVVIGGHKP